MDEVYESLWIGDIQDAREEALGEFGISKVITVCQDTVESNIGCEYTHYNMSDGPDNKYGGDYSFNIYQQASDELFRAINSNKTVLIHCHKGQSRSVSVAMGVICRLENISAVEALNLIKENRPEANPDELLVERAERYAELHSQV
jgi:atypical dual specificity phosphatase